jgi:hypothetical protein
VKPKDVRKQIRNVCQELLTDELTKVILEAVMKRMNERMDLIANNARQTLQDIDNRSKDVQSYVLRNSSLIKE